MNWKRNLWLLWMTQIISLMSFGFGLPFIPYYIVEIQPMDPDTLKLYTTILAAAPAITMGIMAPIWGYLADRYGRKLMIMRAMVFAIFIIGGMGLVNHVYQLVILRLLQGLLTGTVTAAIAFIASNTPKDELPYGLGVISSSTFIGYSLGPILGGKFADLFGYRASFLAGGALMLLGAMIVLLLVKEDKSTLIDPKLHGSEGIFKKYKKILVKSILALMAMLFLLRIGRTVFTAFLPLVVKSYYGKADNLASITGYISAAIGFSTASAGIIVSKWAKDKDKMKVSMVLLFLAFIVSIGFINYHSIHDYISSHIPWFTVPLWTFTLLYAAYYFIIGGIEPLVTATAALQVSPEDRGALFGFQGLTGSLAWFVAPMIAGPLAIHYDTEFVLNVIPVVIILNLIVSAYIYRTTRGCNDSVK